MEPTAPVANAPNRSVIFGLNTGNNLTVVFRRNNIIIDGQAQHKTNKDRSTRTTNHQSNGTEKVGTIRPSVKTTESMVPKMGVMRGAVRYNN